MHVTPVHVPLEADNDAHATDPAAPKEDAAPKEKKHKKEKGHKEKKHKEKKHKEHKNFKLKLISLVPMHSINKLMYSKPQQIALGKWVT